MEPARDCLPPPRTSCPRPWSCAAGSTATPRSGAPAATPRPPCSPRSTGCRWRSRPDRGHLGGRRAGRRRGRGRPCCCAATWTRCRCPRTPASTSRARSTARCTRAGTTRTSRCSSAPPGCSARDATELAGRVRVHVPARRGGLTAAPGTCSTRACSTAAGATVDAAFALHVSTQPAVGIDRGRGRAAHGVGRRAAITVTRQGRARLDAVPRQRSDAGRRRDRAGAAGDGDPARSTCSTPWWSRSRRSAPARRTT